MNLSSRRAWLLAAASAALIAAFLLYPEHRQHFFGLIPYAFLFACPLLHSAMAATTMDATRSSANGSHEHRTGFEDHWRVGADDPAL